MKQPLKVALAGALALLAGAAIAQEQIGVIKRSNGHVVIERAGAQITPAAGSAVLRGDRVVTGADGHVNISMRRAAPLTVGPQADVDLDRYAADKPQVVERPAPALLQGLASFVGINRQR